MKKLIASFLCVLMAETLTPVNLIAAGRIQVGLISGLATIDGKPMANVMLRLRNIDTGYLQGSTTANVQGRFSFDATGSGNFMVESVAPNGTILGTSSPISLTPTSMVASEISVRTTATALNAAGVVAQGQGAAVAGAGGGGLGATAITLIAVGVGLGLTGIIVATNDASASQ